MNFPILFSSTAVTFNTFGRGVLSDAISCVIEEERNGEYELEMEYPLSGIHFSDIELRSLIVAQPNYTDDPQPFRVYKITKPLNGKCTIYAQHISYDMNGIPVSPFTATGIQLALSGLVSNAMVNCPFTLTSTRGTGSTFKVSTPTSLRSWLGGKEGSLLDVYGGEWKFDKYTATLENARGENRGVVIRYGKNLTELKQEENGSSLFTGVVAYWQSTDGDIVCSAIQYAEGTFNYTRIYSLDCSGDYQEAPTVAELNAKAAAYIKANDVEVPNVNLTLDFVQMEGLTERVDLCDTVTVYFEKLGVSATAKCIRTKWDVLRGRYIECELGDAKSNFASTIVGISDKIDGALNRTKTQLEQAIANATQQITGNLGGYVIMHDSDDDGNPDEILIMNTSDIETATKVWRWNKSGLGYSSTGYDGTYGLAMTQDGAIVANYVATGTMYADRIKGGTLTLGGASNGNGVLAIQDASGATIGEWSNAGISITKGSLNIGSGAFVVTTAGAVTATNATITGSVTATSGKVGGWTITSTALYNGSLTGNSSGYAGLSTADFARTINGTSRTGLRFAIGSNFGVTNTGILYAASAVLSGTLTAGSGSKIGGWNVSTALYSGATSLTSTTTGIYLGTDGIRCVGSSDTYVTIRSGRIYFDNCNYSWGAENSYRMNSGGAIHVNTEVQGNNILEGTTECETIECDVLYVDGTQVTSDLRLKEEITDMDAGKASAFIYSLKPKTFYFKKHPEKLRHGLIAQDVQALAPELISEWGDGRLALNYTDMIADIVAVLQEQDKRLQALGG